MLSSPTKILAGLLALAATCLANPVALVDGEVTASGLDAFNATAAEPDAVAPRWRLDVFAQPNCPPPPTQSWTRATTAGCTNLGIQAQSYRFSASTDEINQVSYILVLYANANCQGARFTRCADPNCSNFAFRSFEVLFSSDC
jgi:hypothetical protein